VAQALGALSFIHSENSVNTEGKKEWIGDALSSLDKVSSIEGYSPLHLVAKSGNKKMLVYLL
jgi:hypothetical protein